LLLLLKKWELGRGAGKGYPDSYSLLPSCTQVVPICYDLSSVWSLRPGHLSYYKYLYSLSKHKLPNNSFGKRFEFAGKIVHCCTARSYLYNAFL